MGLSAGEAMVRCPDAAIETQVPLRQLSAMD